MGETRTRARPEPVAVVPTQRVPAARTRWRPPPWLLSLLPGLLMLAAGLFRADRPTLSWDEVTSAEVSSRSVPQILDLLPNLDAVFGPYYLMLHVWSAVAGTSELALRLPSIIAMAAAVTATAELGRRLFTPLTGLTAGLILCLVPNTSRYAAEARPYAFACFFAILAFLLLVEALRRGGPIWIGYGLSVTLLGLSHLIALTTLTAHLALIVVEGRHRLRRWTLVAGAAIVPVLPIAVLGLTQEDTQLHWVAPITLGRIRAMPAEIAGARELVWLLIGLATLAVWHRMTRLIPLAVMAISPPVVLASVSALATPMWVARYLLVILAPLAILAAVALTTVRDGRPHHTVARIVAVLLVLTFSAVPGQHAIRTATAKNGPDYRTIAKIIGTGVRPGDVIVYPAKNRAIRAGTDYYLARQPAAPADPLVRTPSAQTGWLIAEEHPDAIGHLTGAPRIWLVVGDHRADPVTARPELRPLLGPGYRRIGFWHPKRATVALYERRG